MHLIIEIFPFIQHHSLATGLMDSEGCFEVFGVSHATLGLEVVDILVQIKVKCSKAY